MPESQDEISSNFELSFFAPFADTFVDLKSNLALLNYKNIINNSRLRDNISRNAMLSFAFRTAFLKPYNFKNNLELNYFDTKAEEGKIFDNRSFRNSFSSSIKIVKEVSLKISSGIFLPTLEDMSQWYHFVDLSVKLLPKDKKYSIELVAKNILNEKNFERIQISDFGRSIERTAILPAYTFLAFSYNF